MNKKSEKMLGSKCCHFAKTSFLCIEYLQANVQCPSILYAKYENVPVKMEGVELPLLALCIIAKGSNSKRILDSNARFKKLHFDKK